MKGKENTGLVITGLGQIDKFFSYVHVRHFFFKMNYVGGKKMPSFLPVLLPHVGLVGSWQYGEGPGRFQLPVDPFKRRTGRHSQSSINSP